MANPADRGAMLARGSLLEALFDDAHRDFADRLALLVASWGAQPAEWELDRHLPRWVFEELGQAGVFSHRWAPGLLRGLPYSVLTSDMIGPASSSLALAVMTHCEVFLGALTYAAKTPAQLAVLDAAIRGAAVGCFAATERGAGSDLSSLTTTAARGRDGWHVVGEKHWVGNAGTATHALVVARAVDAGRDLGLSLLLVPLDSPGVEVRGFYRKAGLDAIDSADVVFDAHLPEDALLNVPGSALLHATRVLLLERISIAGQMVTASRLALRMAAAHSRRREVFGSKLIDKQAVRHALAQYQAELWSVEALLAHVLRNAGRGADVGREAAALKLMATSTAATIVDGAMQVLGGRGYMASYPLERCWRDIRAARIGGGADEVMREMVAASVDRPDPAMERWLVELDEDDRPRSDDHSGSARALQVI